MRTETWARAALVLALASAAFSFLAYRRAGVPAAPAPCDCEAAVARAAAAPAPAPRASMGNELAVSALSDRVGELERRVGVAGPGAAAATETRSSPGAAPSHAGAGVSVTSKLPAGVTVTRGADGKLSVTNTDPALTGQQHVVEVRQPDGTLTPARIVIPAPKAR